MLRRVVEWVSLGVEPGAETAHVRRVQTINLVAMLAIAFNFSYNIAFLLIDAAALRWIIIVDYISILLFALVLAINAKGHTNLATAVMFVAGPFNLTLVGLIMGISTGGYLFLLILPVSGVLMAPPHDRRTQVLGGVLGLSFFVAVLVAGPNAPDVIAGTAIETVLLVVNSAATALFVAAIALHFRSVADTAEADLAVANERSERLLLNILPDEIATRLKDGEGLIADRAEEVTILFADLVGSTPMSEALSADRMVEVLNEIFTPFDDLADALGLEKIKTVGDAYMAVGGLPTPRADHVEAVADMALAILDEVARHRVEGFGSLEMRVGIHTGPVVAGVIGKRKFSYDLWGDSVNTAARMESHGVPGEIHVTEAVFKALVGRYDFVERGPIEIKGKGAMNTYFLRGRRAPADRRSAR